MPDLPGLAALASVVKMPVLLKEEEELPPPALTGAILVLIILLVLIALAIPITLTVFAAKRNQQGTELYALMCGFLVLMWLGSALLSPIHKGLGGLGGFVGFVGTCVMIHKGGGCGGGGCVKSTEELFRSLGSMAGSVSGSSLSSF